MIVIPLLGGDFDDCDGDGILEDIDCDDSDGSIDNIKWIFR